MVKTQNRTWTSCLDLYNCMLLSVALTTSNWSPGSLMSSFSENLWTEDGYC